MPVLNGIRKKNKVVTPYINIERYKMESTNGKTFSQIQEKTFPLGNTPLKYRELLLFNLTLNARKV